MDEKRKRMEEQENPSKRHETRSTEKKEDAEASRALRTKDGDSSRKGESSKRVEEMVRLMRVDVEDLARKTRTMPTYNLWSDIAQMTNLKKILKDRVLDSHVTLSLRELFGIRKKEFHGMIVDLEGEKGESQMGKKRSHKKQKKNP